MSIYAIEVSPEGTTLAVGAGGLILRSADGGVSWNQRPSGTANDLLGVAYGNVLGSEGWVAVGINGLCLRSTDDGTSWSTVTPFTGATLYDVCWTGVLLAVGAGGVLFLSDDLGATWEEKSSGTTADLLDISYTEGLYTIVGDGGVLIVGEVETLEKEAYVAEGVGLLLSGGVTGTLQHDLAEALESADGYGWTHIDTSLVETEGGERQHVFLSESLGAYDYSADPNGEFHHGASETLGLLQAFIANGAFQHLAESALTATGAAERERVILREAVENLSASGLLSAQQVWRLVETVRALSAATSGGAFNHVVTQKLSAKEKTVVSWLLTLTEGVAATATAAQRFETALKVTEKLSVAGVFSSRLQAAASAAVSVLLSEELAAGKGADAVESLTLSPALTSRSVALCAQIETAILNEAAEKALTLRLPVTETVEASTETSVGQALRNLIEEGVGFALSFGLAGESYRGWVMNTRNFAVTEYQGYPFNSLCKFGNVYLGANGGGIYRLDGDDDDGAPIAARFALGATDFGRSEEKRLERVYLGFRADGDLLLKVVTDENVERWYTVRGTTEKAHRRAVDNWTKGVQGNYWQFELENTEGEDFEIDAFHFVPIYLTRRI